MNGGRVVIALVITALKSGLELYSGASAWLKALVFNPSGCRAGIASCYAGVVEISIFLDVFAYTPPGG